MSKTKFQSHYLLVGALVCGSSMAVAVFFGAPQPKPQSLSDAVAENRMMVPNFKLTDANGKKVSRDDIKGPWIASFMFADCGTQCPMMTAKMSTLSKKLPSVSFVSFSVNSDDTPAKLKRFAKAYNADWTFLAGGPGEVKKLSMEGFKLPIAEGKSKGEEIVHSKNLVLVDPNGRIRGYYDSDDGSSMESLVSAASKY
jgi:cytochrome oxidase Cu insertion factor (SCO1/SenC/PrrC family)